MKVSVERAPERSSWDQSDAEIDAPEQHTRNGDLLPGKETPKITCIPHFLVTGTIQRAKETKAEALSVASGHAFRYTAAPTGKRVPQAEATMLKAQLRSKIFQLELPWQEVEDILTGDFFGVLDYLPRQPFLRDFVQNIVELNPGAAGLRTDNVRWNDVKLVLWPRLVTDGEQVEPDVLIISNRWIIVTEVKLESGLGNRQPWREYTAGKVIAREHGLSVNAIYYLLITTRHEDVATTFLEDDFAEREELASRTLYVRWWGLIAMIDDWLTVGLNGTKVSAENSRMLEDLAAALRLRRSLAFAGFAFVNQRDVVEMARRIFCPERFRGFMGDVTAEVEAVAMWQASRFDGFGMHSRVTELLPSYIVPPSFAGFLQDGCTCEAARTLRLVG